MKTADQTQVWTAISWSFRSPSRLPRRLHPAHPRTPTPALRRAQSPRQGVSTINSLLGRIADWYTSDSARNLPPHLERPRHPLRPFTLHPHPIRVLRRMGLPPFLQAQ